MIRSALRMTKQTPLAARGMVVAEHPIGAEVGAGILARGGNAVDAAVATAFAMPVVEPFMSTLAGGGSFLIHMARRGETVAIDANVEAPARAHEHCYELGEGVSDDLFPWRRVVGDANVFGPRSVAIPGSVAGLCLALRRYGTMALSDVVAPAIRLAEEGFIPDWYVAQSISLYTRELRAFPETARTYLRDGLDIYRPPASHDGDLLRQPDLGRSLRLIAKEGPDAFYRGSIAQAIHDEVQGGGGYLTRDDLAGYEARVLSPLTGGYRGLELAFMPGATGGITALEILNLLAEFPSAQVTYRTLGGLHLRAEAVRLAFLDRLRYLGDALRVTAPWDGLASRAYAHDLARQIKPAGRTTASPPDPWKYGPNANVRGGGRAGATGTARGDENGKVRDGESSKVRGGESGKVRGGGRAGAISGPPLMVNRTSVTDCTTHIGVIDRQRNMVSFTNTAVSLFGARMVVPGTGILLQNGMIWFDPEPGRVNSVAAGKRPLVNMVPVLGFRKGEPLFTLGAPGGRKIVAVVPQVISNMADAGDGPQAAVEAPRLHTEGGELLVDDRVGEAVLAGLRKRKHPVTPKHSSVGNLFFARPIAIRITRKGLEAGLDTTSDASAAGV
jgi:gamma-glutamyltranspeptidase/glutathione hydrolase